MSAAISLVLRFLLSSHFWDVAADMIIIFKRSSRFKRESYKSKQPVDPSRWICKDKHSLAIGCYGNGGGASLVCICLTPCKLNHVDFTFLWCNVYLYVESDFLLYFRDK